MKKQNRKSASKAADAHAFGSKRVTSPIRTNSMRQQTAQETLPVSATVTCTRIMRPPLHFYIQVEFYHVLDGNLKQLLLLLFG